MCHARAFPAVICPMPTSRIPPQAAGRTAKPESIRAAHQQISRNDGTLADIAALIELEGKARIPRNVPAQPLRHKPDTQIAEAAALPYLVEPEGNRLIQQQLFGISIPAILSCVLILGTALGVPLGVLTYGTAVYTALMKSLAAL